jgi:hypothetical protein
MRHEGISLKVQKINISSQRCCVRKQHTALWKKFLQQISCSREEKMITCVFFLDEALFRLSKNIHSQNDR